MKKTILFLCALVLSLGIARAVPAHPKAMPFVQPDGTQVMLRLIGDEWLHFNTTEDGYSVVMDARGYYVYAELAADGTLKPTAHIAHDFSKRTADEKAFLSTVKKRLAPKMDEETFAIRQKVRARQQKKLVERRAAQYDYNNFRGLIILIEYSNKSFSRNDYKDIIDHMVNDENYSGYYNANGQKETFTGSVRDYYSDNSNGLFQPQFDIYGPVKVNYSQTQGNNQYMQILNAAINAVDSQIDFSDYDRDGDGKVDMIYFILAGNGSNYGGNNSGLWWPHRSVLYNTNNYSWLQKDGVRLYDYASSVELYGWTSAPSTVTIDGIGTICHEFSHVLGLPDFYDADYEKSGGESNHPDNWSIMAGGSYENIGRTPVGYSLYERYATGFAVPTLIEHGGNFSLEQIGSSNTGYRINTTVDNEYFLLENRQPSMFKWDEYLPGHGMVVFRVDRTNTNIWDNNQVNNNPAHNYYELLRAGGAGYVDPYTEHTGSDHDPFPGTNNVTELHSNSSPANLKSWTGQETPWIISNISENSGVISFSVAGSYALESLTLPDAITVYSGMHSTLTPVANPSLADYILTWESSDNNIATVDENGVVTGIAAGTCTITTTSDNGISASCQVTVEDIQTYTISEFKALPQDSEVFLGLDGAEVTYVSSAKAYIRDATGALLLNNTGLDIKKNDRISGIVMLKADVDKDMPIATAIEGVTNDELLTITQGDEVQPHEKTIDELSAADYADFITIKSTEIKRVNNILYAYNDNRDIHLSNTATLRMVDFTDKLYDIIAIYGTTTSNNEVIDDLQLLSTPVQVADISVKGITMISEIDLYEEDTYTLSVEVTPENAKFTLTWSSSDETVATVSDGTVTALKEGVATITVKSNNGTTATCKVTVKAKPIEDGIEHTTYDQQPTTKFNLQGQAVDNAYKGIIIRDGKKHINK